MKRVLSEKVAGLKPSGIRLFFEIAATMKDVISLGIGEPDFATPEPIIQAGVEALRRGETHYTSNHGIHVLRQAIDDVHPLRMHVLCRRDDIGIDLVYIVDLFFIKSEYFR